MKNWKLTLVAVLALNGCAADKESSSMLLAKEMCSCYFLVGQTESNCRDAIRLGLALGDVKLDKKNKEAIGTDEKGQFPATFRFVDARYGCELKEEGLVAGLKAFLR